MRHERKRANNHVFSPVLHSDTMSNVRTKTRDRDEILYTQKIAYFIHKLIYATTNIQILETKHVEIRMRGESALENIQSESVLKNIQPTV